MIREYLRANLKSLILISITTISTIIGLSIWCNRIGEPLFKSILAVSAVSPYLFFYLALLFNHPMQSLQEHLRRKPFDILYLGITLMVPYFLYCMASQTFHWLGLVKLVVLMLGPLMYRNFNN
ncbi:MAG: hypothetical protein AB8G05_18510 [Oligoflexales bacterium]